MQSIAAAVIGGAVDIGKSSAMGLIAAHAIESAEPAAHAGEQWRQCGIAQRIDERIEQRERAPERVEVAR